MSMRHTEIRGGSGAWLLVLLLTAWPIARGHAQEPAASPPLFVDCRGAPSASPTVILEAGAFGTSADWDRVLDDLSTGGRACAYDRAGVGLSPPRPGGLGVIDKARELRGLLDQIGESGPIILVGHSNGALYAEAFARLYPERLAGLVYVNGVGTDDLAFPPLMANLAQERRLSKMAVTLARLGLAPLVAETLSEGGLSPPATRRKRAALECLRCLEVARDEDRLIVAGLKETAALPDNLQQIPSVVITGDPSPGFDLAPIWRKAEIAPAARADHGWILDAPGASHVSPLSRDRAYVDAAVAWLRAPYLKAP
jgi:pimeloyl-ACP methyl ester carboxylesterase